MRIILNQVNNKSSIITNTISGTLQIIRCLNYDPVCNEIFTKNILMKANR